MLDELIRSALNEAAAECVMPNYIDECILGRIALVLDPGSGGTSDE